MALGMYKVSKQQEPNTKRDKSVLPSIGISVASGVRRPLNRDSPLKNSVLSNTKKLSEKVKVSVRKNKKTYVASKNVFSKKKIVTNVDVKNNLKAKDVLCASCAKNVLIPCHDKCLANYKLNVHSKVRKPNVEYFLVFGSLCYPTNDREDLEKMKPKANIGIFIGYSETSRRFRIYNRRTKKIMETIHVKFDELTTMASEHDSSKPVSQRFINSDSSADTMNNPSKEDLDNSFRPIYDEYFENRSSDMSINYTAHQVHNHEDSPSTSSIIVEEHKAPPIVTTSEEQTSPISLNEADEFDQDTLQPDGFVDPYFPNHVYMLKKALYGLKQAPQACIYFFETEYQLADLFTKALLKERFEYFVHRIGACDKYHNLEDDEMVKSIFNSGENKKSHKELEAKQNEDKVKEHLMAEEIKKLVEGTENVEENEVDSSTHRNYMSGHILHMHPTQASLASTQEQQYQLVLTMKDNPQLQQDDLPIWLVLKYKFKRLYVSDTSYRPSSIRLRDQDDPHDDAYLDGDNSAKRQKTFKHVTYVFGESSSGQVNEKIVARRENGSIVSITESSYKNLNKNDIKDLYLLIVNGKVDDYVETGLMWSLSKFNLTAPTTTFPGIEKYKVFSIISKPVCGIICKNSKKEKRVMRHQEVHKFCNATLKRVLEGLKSYNNNVKHYVTLSLSKEDAEYLQLFKEEIEERLKHHDQMRRWQMYVKRRQLGLRRESPE
nr:hypothetical protein [Tanacetum cinerariifolium]